MTQNTDIDTTNPHSVSLHCEISPEFTGKRLDKVAVELWPEFSRTQITTWIKSGALCVGDAKVTPAYRVMGGEMLYLEAELQAAEHWHVAQPVDFSIVYEDEYLLVIDKPAGLVVHPGAGNQDQTLVNGLLNFDPAQSVLPRAGLIHRLDKDTSGLLLVARKSRSFKLLTAALKDREVKRRYHAVVEGVLTGGFSVEQPIARDPQNRTRQKVHVGGKPALTHIMVLERFRAHTLIEAQLETGRTHQIRVHMSHAGYPLLGDPRYGARSRLPKDPHPDLLASIRNFKRQALHAQTLEFTHPGTGEWIQCRSDRPADLTYLLETLQADRDSYVE